jgi:hypothetical protein
LTCLIARERLIAFGRLEIFRSKCCWQDEGDIDRVGRFVDGSIRH